MKEESKEPQGLSWQCYCCRRELVTGPVTVSYMGNRFTTDLPHCPGCGIILVSEEIAWGRMAEVEQMLEDK